MANARETALKPCPFCGGEARAHVREALRHPYYAALIECSGCPVELEGVSSRIKSDDELLAEVREAWNSRVEP